MIYFNIELIVVKYGNLAPRTGNASMKHNIRSPDDGFWRLQLFFCPFSEFHGTLRSENTCRLLFDEIGCEFKSVASLKAADTWHHDLASVLSLESVLCGTSRQKCR